jgi:SAM-dependent methyltransferase
MVTGADPAAIKRLGNAFCAAKLLLTAADLGVFSTLEREPATAARLAATLEVHPRGIPDFLTALVALGLLARDGDRYRNTEATSQLLIPGKDSYVGGYLRRADRMLYPAWAKLGDAIRTGRPQAADAFAAMSADPAKLKAFLDMMDSVNGRLVPDLLAAFPWERYRTVADVGGARGNLLARLAQAYPHLSGVVFDLPAIGPAATEHLTALGVADQVRFQPGDFFADPMPAADVVILGHVLHNWAPEERAMLVKKAYDAVPAGGALLVYDAMLEPGSTDLDKILVSLNMLLVTEGGSEYTTEDCQTWLSSAGFHDLVVRPLGPNDILVSGLK